MTPRLTLTSLAAKRFYPRPRCTYPDAPGADWVLWAAALAVAMTLVAVFLAVEFGL